MPADEPDRPLTWRNWSREQLCHPAEIVQPRTREGLVAAIIGAREAGRRIRVAGSGHSFTGAALTEGTLLRLEALDRLLDFDPGSGLLRIEAGAVLGETNRRLDGLGRAFENLGDIDRQTLAGAISTATHGTGTGFENLSAQIEAIELIGADGTSSVLGPRDRETFRAARVGLGALGVVYALTLRTVPAFRIDRLDHALPLREVLDGLEQRAEAHDHFEFYVFPHTDVALCRESRRTEEPPRPPAELERYLREVVLENWATGAMTAIARALPTLGPAMARAAVANFASSTKLDKSYRVFASERRLRFTEMEYALPRARGREAVEQVLEIASRPETRCVFPIEVRFVKGDDALLSPSFQRDSCYVAVHQDRALDWASYFDAAEAVLVGLGGRPHWGKRHQLTATELEPRYPRWAEFQRARARLDPDGAFGNAYTDLVLGPVQRRRRRRRRG